MVIVEERHMRRCFWKYKRKSFWRNGEKKSEEFSSFSFHRQFLTFPFFIVVFILLHLQHFIARFVDFAWLAITNGSGQVYSSEDSHCQPYPSVILLPFHFSSSTSMRHQLAQTFYSLLFIHMLFISSFLFIANSVVVAGALIFLFLFADKHEIKHKRKKM